MNNEKINENTLMQLQKEMHNVPFGNSVFQIEKFVANEYSPERRYRSCLLQLDQKLSALQHNKFGRDRTLIDLDEIECKLSNKDLGDFERRRLEIDLAEKKWGLDKQEKLIKDCMIEVLAYVNALENTPKCTREQFENAELGYWQARLLNDAQTQVTTLGYMKDDTAQSLQKIGIGVGRNENGQLMYNVLSLEDKKQE